MRSKSVTITQEILVKKKVQDSTLNQPAKKMKINDHNYCWGDVSPPDFDTSFGREGFDVLPENYKGLTLQSYFQIFQNKDLNKLIAKQSNLYSVQKDERV